MLRIAWLLATAVALGYALWQRWPDVEDAFRTLELGQGLAATVFAVLGVGVSGLVWRRILAGLGHALSLAETARIFFVGQIGKYLPGSVWPILAQMELGRDLHVAPRTSAAAVGSFLWVHLVTGGLVATSSLAVSGLVPAWIGFVGLGLALLLWSPLVRGALRLAVRITRRDDLERYPDQRTILVASGWALAMWAAYGTQLMWLVPMDGAPGWLGSTGSFAAGWVLGFLFLIAPAGAGARETVIVALLTGTLPVGTALAIVVVSRVVMTVADGLWGAVGLIASHVARDPRVQGGAGSTGG